MATERYRVLILPQEQVLDVQGRAVEKTLSRLQFPNCNVRVGRVIEVTIEGGGAGVPELIRKMTEDVFFNPLIETFQIVKLTDEATA